MSTTGRFAALQRRWAPVKGRNRDGLGRQSTAVGASDAGGAVEIAMITYSARMHRSAVPVEQIAASLVERLDVMLSAFVRDRALIGPERSIDVRFDDFMADELGTTEQIYALAGEPVSSEARAAMTDYLAAQQRNRLGRVATPCDMFGLGEFDLRQRFAPYVSRFLS